MRNLKKILALVLVLVMSFSLVSVASAKVTFTDEDEITYDLAVDLLSGMGVLTGYTDGSFQPEGTIKRAEMAAIIYRLTTADVKGEDLELFKGFMDFSDTKGHWASAYISYCASKGYIVGYNDGTFKPNAEVTGTEALIMILRAVGYNKTNVFSGNSWKMTAWTYGEENGITDGISSYMLNDDATREIVAQMALNALFAPMVTYTASAGYTPYKNVYQGILNKDLGEETFDLVGPTLTSDNWGRPSYKYTYNTGDESTTYPVEVKYETFTMVDECDIAHALGDKNYDIESAWIDGVEKVATSTSVTSNGVGTINKLATTSKVGAQGRETEIYILNNGKVRIVEINTYLAKVVSIVPGYVDKNGHPVDAYSVLEVYVPNAANSEDGVLADTNFKINLKTADTSNALNSFVLVTCNDETLAAQKVASVEAATITPAGGITGWYNRTHYQTVGTTSLTAKDYNDADKFVLEMLVDGSDANNTTDARTHGGNWDAITDKNGNLIGLVPTSFNYLVVEAIRWEDSATVLGGHALANVVLSDGTRVQNVEVAKVNATAVSNNLATVGVPAAATVADDVLSNTAYYDTITTYTVVDGKYYLDVDSDSTYNDATGFHNDIAAAGADLLAKQTQFTVDNDDGTTNGTDATFYMNDYTTYLVKQADGTYTKYVGKDNIPNMLDVKLAYVNGADGYASLVVVFAYTSAAVTFDAYVDDVASNKIVTIAGTDYFEFNVYKAGETTATKVYQLVGVGETSSKLDVGTVGTDIADEGIYKFTLSANNVIAAANVALVVDELDGTDAGETAAVAGNLYNWAADYVQLFQNGNTLVVDSAKALTGTELSYGILSTTKVFVVDYDANRSEPIVIAENTQSLNDLLVEGAYVIVATPAAGGNAAQIVYVLKGTGVAAPGGTPAAPGDASTLTVSATGNVVTATYTNKSGAGQTGLSVTWQYRIAGTTTWTNLEVDPIAGTLADQAADSSATVTIAHLNTTLTYEVRAVVGTIESAFVTVIA